MKDKAMQVLRYAEYGCYLLTVARGVEVNGMPLSLFTQVSFDLQDVLHTFKREHRVMIQIQSTWFPLIDRNPQKWVDNIFEANDEDFVRDTNRVHRSIRHPSRIRIGVLP